MENIKNKINCTRSTRITVQYSEDYQTLNKEVKRTGKCRRDKRENMNRMIQEAEDAAARGEQGTLYKITKKIGAKYSSGSSVVRHKDGKILMKEKDIQERWEEHFKEVLTGNHQLDQ